MFFFFFLVYAVGLHFTLNNVIMGAVISTSMVDRIAELAIKNGSYY